MIDWQDFLLDGEIVLKTWLDVSMVLGNCLCESKAFLNSGVNDDFLSTCASSEG